MLQLSWAPLLGEVLRESDVDLHLQPSVRESESGLGSGGRGWVEVGGGEGQFFEDGVGGVGGGEVGWGLPFLGLAQEQGPDCPRILRQTHVGLSLANTPFRLAKGNQKETRPRHFVGVQVLF